MSITIIKLFIGSGFAMLYSYLKYEVNGYWWLIPFILLVITLSCGNKDEY